MTDLELHDYQLVARDFLRERDKAGLFLDMGLGKTACSLTALEERHLPVLVIAPKRVAENVWSKETALWRPDLTVAVAAGSPAERAESLASKADIVTLGIDNIKDVAKIKRDTPFRTIILDELSRFKGRGVWWKEARKIVAGVDHVWGLTGTPAPNGLLDLWPQIYLLDGGQRLGKNITTYRSRYFYPGRSLPNGVIYEWHLKPESEANIHGLVEDLCLSMETEGRIDLPPLTYNIIEVTMPPTAKKAYKDLRDDLVADLSEVFGEIHTAGSPGALTNRLSQIAAGFLYVDDADLHNYAATQLHTEKVKAVREVVDGTGSPVWVFYRYNYELEMLKKEFGDEAFTLKDDNAIDRWNDGQVPVMLAHPASVSHGLNLQYGGHTQVWTSLPWDLELWDQGIKRHHRQGQEHPVVVHIIQAKGTIDPAIKAALVDKAEVQDALLAHLESPL